MENNNHLQEMLASINHKLDLLISDKEDKTNLLTRNEYLKALKITSPTLWRQEKNGLIKPIIIGQKKYYKL